MVVNDIMYNKKQQQKLKYRNKCHKFQANNQEELIKQPKDEDFYYTLRKYGCKTNNTTTTTTSTYTHKQKQHSNSYCCSTQKIITLHHKAKRSNIVGVGEACCKGACKGLYMWLVVFVLMLILCGNTVISQQRIINNNGNNNNYNNNIGNILLQISTQTPPATLTNNNSNRHNNNRNISVDGRDDGGGSGGDGGNGSSLDDEEKQVFIDDTTTQHQQRQGQRQQANKSNTLTKTTTSTSSSSSSSSTSSSSSSSSSFSSSSSSSSLFSNNAPTLGISNTKNNSNNNNNKINNLSSNNNASLILNDGESIKANNSRSTSTNSRSNSKNTNDSSEDSAEILNESEDDGYENSSTVSSTTNRPQRSSIAPLLSSVQERERRLMNVLAARRTALQRPGFRNRIVTTGRTAAATAAVETTSKSPTDPRSICIRNCTKNFTRRTTASCMRQCANFSRVAATANIAGGGGSTTMVVKHASKTGTGTAQAGERDTNEILFTDESSHGLLVIAKEQNDTLNHIPDENKGGPVAKLRGRRKQQSQVTTVTLATTSIEDDEIQPYLYFGQKLPPLKPNALTITSISDEHPKLLEVSVADVETSSTTPATLASASTLSAVERSRARFKYNMRNGVSFNRRYTTINRSTTSEQPPELRSTTLRIVAEVVKEPKVVEKINQPRPSFLDKFRDSTSPRPFMEALREELPRYSSTPLIITVLSDEEQMATSPKTQIGLTTKEDNQPIDNTTLPITTVARSTTTEATTTTIKQPTTTKPTTTTTMMPTTTSTTTTTTTTTTLPPSTTASTTTTSTTTPTSITMNTGTPRSTEPSLAIIPEVARVYQQALVTNTAATTTTTTTIAIPITTTTTMAPTPAISIPTTTKKTIISDEDTELLRKLGPSLTQPINTDDKTNLIIFVNRTTDLYRPHVHFTTPKTPLSAPPLSVYGPHSATTDSSTTILHTTILTSIRSTVNTIRHEMTPTPNPLATTQKVFSSTTATPVITGEISSTVVTDDQEISLEMQRMNIVTMVLAGIGIVPLLAIILYLVRNYLLKRPLKDDEDFDVCITDQQPISPVKKLDHKYQMEEEDQDEVDQPKKPPQRQHSLHSKLVTAPLARDNNHNVSLNLTQQQRYDDKSSVTSDQEFDRSNIRLKSLLGEGNFGQVWKAEADDLSGHFGATRIVAVKTIKACSTQLSLKDEANIMRKLGSHQNVVTLLGACVDSEPHMLIMEYAMRGRLLSLLRAARNATNILPASVPGGRSLTPLSPRTLAGFCLDIARGMEYIAEKRIVHRDLAARNVLLDHNGVCKICDFGMSIDLDAERKRKELEKNCANEIMRSNFNKFKFDFGGKFIMNHWAPGTPKECSEKKSHHGQDTIGKRPALPIRWMAPEALQYNFFSTETDIWAFGIVLWEIATLGSTPYSQITGREVIRRVPQGLRPDLPKEGRHEFYNLMSRCWHKDPQMRPSFSQCRLEISRSLHKWVDDDSAASDYMDVSGFSEDLEQGMVYFNHRISEFECEI